MIHRLANGCLFVLLICLLPLSVSGNVDHWHGSRTIPPHRLNLKAPGGAKIVPECDRNLPFSASETCGPCHDYATISSGTHFSAKHKKDGRAGEPWVWVDLDTGTQLPVADELGISSWRFVELFGRHMPGGGIGEQNEPTANPAERWNVSGPVEINCLGCHNASPRQDQSEWAKQLARENFMWAGTAASGLGDVSSMASRVKDSWTLYDGANLDDRLYADPPAVTYHLEMFDAKGRAFMEVDRPQDKRCLYCHSVHETGKDRIIEDVDVHTAAGIKCVDCHRNSLDHKISRGFETGDPEKDVFTCKGCHMVTGRMGAPKPEHKGLPPLHLEKISCTACHSGTEDHSGPRIVQTSRINRLGIYGRAQWMLDSPAIQAPVMAKAEDGKITPHRAMWPAYWGYLSGSTVEPLLPDQIAELSKGVLDAEKFVGDILQLMVVGGDEMSVLAGSEKEFVEGVPVFISKGKVFKRNIDGELDIVNFTGAIPSGMGKWGYYCEGEKTELVPLVQKWDESAGALGGSLEKEQLLVKVLERLLKSPRCAGTPVVATDGKFFKFASVRFISATPEEVKRVSQASEQAKKKLQAEMKARSIVFVDGKYYRKTDWKYDKVRITKENDLQDLQELASQAESLQADMDRLLKFGNAVYTKVVRVSDDDISELKADAEAKRKEFDEAMKKDSITEDNGKFFKVENGSKKRIYILRENKSLFRQMQEAEKARKMLDSVRTFEGQKYRQVFPGDSFVDKAVVEYVPSALPSGGFQLGCLQKGVLAPLVPDYVAEAVPQIDSSPALFTEDQAVQFLKKLHKEGSEPVYIGSGKLFKLDASGKLAASDHPAAAPVLWPMAHNVTGVSSSLGAKKCSECHSVSAPFFFKSVEAMGPMLTDKAAVTSMTAFMGIKSGYHKLFGLSFVVRPMFKLAMLGLALLTLAVLLVYFLLGLDWVTRNLSLPVIEKLVAWLCCGSMVVLVITGFVTAVCLGRPLTGYSLIIHNLFGALFMACITVLAVLRARQCAFVGGSDLSVFAKSAFWVLVLCAVCLVLSVLIAMVPLLDTHYQHFVIIVHRYVAVVAVLAAVFWVFARKKR